MKRWISLAAAFGLALQSASLTAGAQEAARQESSSRITPYQYGPSPSDLPVRTARRATPDDPWMRGLDDMVGPDDGIGGGAVGSSIRPRGADLYDGFPAEELPFVHPPNCPCCIDNTPVSRFRQSCYQGSSFSAGILGDGGGDGLTTTHYELSTRWALPIDGMDNAIVITPSFRHEFLDAPSALDIPDELFVTGVNFSWFKTLSPRTKMTAMIAPSVRSDMETGNDAFRLFGLGMLTYKYIPETLDASIGVVYLDRDDIPVLPVAGFTWTPTPDWRVEMNFPRPRVAYRTAKAGSFSESWIYSGVALGGNTYAVERANGNDDVLTIRDYQWVFGWEHLRSGGRGLFVEAGAAFGRTLEYEETDEEYDFDDALFIRGGLTL